MYSKLLRNLYKSLLILWFENTKLFDISLCIIYGLDETGVLRVVVHTFEQSGQSSCRVRIISARKATVREAEYYQERRL